MFFSRVKNRFPGKYKKCFSKQKIGSFKRAQKKNVFRLKQILFCGLSTRNFFFEQEKCLGRNFFV